MRDYGKMMELWTLRRSSVLRRVYVAIVGWTFVGGWLRMREVLPVLRKLGSEPENILDAGCGMGAFTVMLSNLFGRAHIDAVDWEATDRFRGQLASVRQMLDDMGLSNVAVSKVNLLDMHESRKYDLIVNIDVLEHIPGNKKIMRAFFAALRPGGTLILHMPAKGVAASSPFFPESVLQAIRDEHIGEMYDCAGLKQALIGVGFTQVEVRTTFHWFSQWAWEWDKIIYYRLRFAYPLMLPFLKILGALGQYLRLGRGYGILAIASRTIPAVARKS